MTELISYQCARKNTRFGGWKSYFQKDQFTIEEGKCVAANQSGEQPMAKMQFVAIFEHDWAARSDEYANSRQSSNQSRKLAVGLEKSPWAIASSREAKWSRKTITLSRQHKSDDATRQIFGEPKKISYESLQNTSGPGDSYRGHKGHGYKVLIMETITDSDDKDQTAKTLNLNLEGA